MISFLFPFVHRQKRQIVLRMLSLCSGIGGADLAAEMTGHIQIIGQVERDPYCNQVLAQQYHNVKRMHDIKEVQGHEFGHIDLCVTGLPCQPHSLAGKKRGASDERNLWPALRAILQRQCDRGEAYRWVIIENVRGLLNSTGERYKEKGGMFFEIVQEMVSMGYRVGWSVFGACEAGAPHRRERVFVVAYHDSYRLRQRPHQSQLLTKRERTTQHSKNSARIRNVDDTKSRAARRLPSRTPATHPITGEPSSNINTRGMAHTQSEECTAPRIRSGSEEIREVSDIRSTDSGADVAHPNSSQWRPIAEGRHDTNGDNSRGDKETSRPTALRQHDRGAELADTYGQRWGEGWPQHEIFKRNTTTTSSRGAEPSTDMAHASEQRLQERRGSKGERGTRANAHGSSSNTREAQSALGGELDGFSYRLDTHKSHQWPSRPGEPQHTWEPKRVIPPDEKLPNRVAQLKALGNGIVPQQLYLLLNEIVKFEQAQDQAQEVGA
jgi:DNA-cytosine methyltransferase